MKKIIKVVGADCPECTKTKSVIEKVINDNNIEADIVRVDDSKDIMTYNIRSNHALIIDDEVKLDGHVPTCVELLDLLD